MPVTALKSGSILLHASELQLSLLLNDFQASEHLLSSYSFGKVKELIKMISSLLDGFFLFPVLAVTILVFHHVPSCSLEGFHLLVSALAINNLSRQLLHVVICLWVSGTGRLNVLLNLKRLYVKLSYRKRLAEKLVLFFFFSILLLLFLLRNFPNLLAVNTGVNTVNTDYTVCLWVLLIKGLPEVARIYAA